MVSRQGNFEIVVTRSAGTDGAVLIFVDGEFPDGVRFVVNDNTTHGTPGVNIDQDNEAGDVRITVRGKDIDYT